MNLSLTGLIKTNVEPVWLDPTKEKAFYVEMKMM